MITVAILGWLARLSRSQALADPPRVWRDFLPALPALLTPVLLVGGMLLGYLHADRGRLDHRRLRPRDQRRRLSRAELAPAALLGLRDRQEHARRS